MIKNTDNLSSKEKILLHLYKYDRYKSEIDVPISLTQQGLIEVTRIGQGTLSTALRNLEEDGYIHQNKRHIKRERKSRKVYFLTEKGISEVKALERNIATSSYIDHSDQNPEIRYFFGRNDELKEFQSWISHDKSKILIVTGIAGMGKTTFVNKAIEPYKKSEHIFWHRFNEWSTLNNLLVKFGHFLSEVDLPNLRNHLESIERIDLNEIFYILSEDLENLYSIIIFDDLQKVKKNDDLVHFINMLKQILESGSDLKVIIISREKPGDFYDERDVSVKGLVKFLHLSGLDLNSTGELLSLRGIDREKTQDIFEYTKGHPLSLEVFRPSSQFTKQPEIMNFLSDEILRNITAEETRILEVASVFRYPVDPTAYLEITGPVSDKLSEDNLPISLLALTSEEDSSEDKHYDHDIIDSLMKKSLFQTLEGYCTLHDLIREFMYNRLTPSKKESYHEKVGEYYLRFDNPQSVLESAFHLSKAGKNDRASRVLVDNQNELRDQGFWGECLDVSNQLDITGLEEEQIGDVYLMKGTMNHATGDYDRALVCFNDAISNYTKASNRVKEARAISKISHLQVGSNLNEALENTKKALVLLKGTDELLLIGIINYLRGSIYSNQGDIKEALAANEMAIQLFKKIGDNKSLARCHLLNANILLRQGEYDKALEQSDLVISFCKENEMVYLLTYGYSVRANIEKYMNNHQNSISYMEKSLSLAKKYSMINRMGYDYSNGAEMILEYVRSDSFPNDGDKDAELNKALEYCESAIGIFEKLNEQHMIGNTKMVLGMIFQQKQDWAQSEKYFDEALKTVEDTGHIYILAQVHERYGRMLIDRGDEKSGRLYLEKAIEKWETLGNLKRVESIQEILASHSE